MDWTWTIPNLEPYVLYVIAVLMAWVGKNALTITIILFILDWANKQAIKLEEVKDNKIKTMIGYYLVMFTKFLIDFFKFGWLTQFAAGKKDDIPKPDTQTPAP